MKRAIMLGLMAMGLVAGGLFTTKPAEAAVVTCSQANPSPTGTVWPDLQWTQYCTGTTQANGQAMASAVKNATSVAGSELKRANNGNFGTATAPLNGVRYLLFASPQDYTDSASSLGLGTAASYGASDFGVTVFNSHNVPVYSAIFMKNQNGETANIARATGQQIGRSLDFLEGYVNNGGILPPQNYRFSDYSSSQAFQNLYYSNLSADYTTLNTKTPCGSTGLFYGYADSTYPGPNYICSGTNGTGSTLSAAYAGLNNQAILHQAWPTIYPAAGIPASGALAGLFAEQYSKAYIGNDVAGSGRSADTYLNKGFACTNWLVQSVAPNEKLTSNGMPTGCTAPSVTTACVKIFTGEGYFPDGNVFNCAGTSAVPGQISNNLKSLGKATNGGVIGYTAVKAVLTVDLANVYVFSTPAAYNSAFATAGQPAVTDFTTADAGESYPNSNMWYSLIDLAASTGGSAPANFFTEVAAHELGHVVDLVNSGDASASVAFNTAMQNDWLFLDYQNGNQSTPRLPCGGSGYTGPLANIIDPTTGVAFCTGTVIEPKWDPAHGYNLVSKILQDPSIGAYLTHVTGPSSAGFNPSVTYSQGWIEWFAQSFAIVSDYDTSGTGYYIFDAVVKNGYLGCTAGDGVHNPNQGYLIWVYAQKPVNMPSNCTQALPSWWTPIY